MGVFKNSILVIMFVACCAVNSMGQGALNKQRLRDNIVAITSLYELKMAVIKSRESTLIWLAEDDPMDPSKQFLIVNNDSIIPGLVSTLMLLSKTWETGLQHEFKEFIDMLNIMLKTQGIIRTKFVIEDDYYYPIENVGKRFDLKNDYIDVDGPQAVKIKAIHNSIDRLIAKINAVIAYDLK